MLFIVSSASLLDGTPRISRFKLPGNSSNVSGTRPALPLLQRWHWNIDQFPFPRRPLGGGLGPANPRPIVVVGEFLPLGWLGLQPSFDATIGRILDATRSTGPYGPASARAARLSTLCLATSGVSARILPPSILAAELLGWSAVTR